MKKERKVVLNKNWVKILIAVAGGLLVLGILFIVMDKLEQAADREEIQGAGTSVHAETRTKTISHNGQSFTIKKHMKTVLLIGIDSDKQPGDDEDTFYNFNQADFLLLIASDPDKKTNRMIHINRDTMCDVPWLSVEGKKGGTKFEQIAFAHTYGSGKQDSCKNTVEAVSDLLMGLPIDNYVCLSMQGVPAITDVVGGVTVTVTDDFSSTDPFITKGQVCLEGQHALTFVRARKSVGNGTNLERMERQKEYMNRFIETFRTATEMDPDIAGKVSDVMEQYTITDFTATGLISAMQDLYRYGINDIQSLKGEAKNGEQYVEFYIEKDSAYDILKDVFGA